MTTWKRICFKPCIREEQGNTLYLLCVCASGSLPGRGGGAGRDHAGSGAAAGAGRPRGCRAGVEGTPGPVWHCCSALGRHVWRDV